MAAFDINSTTDEVLQGVDLKGKTVLVTGGTAGLGAETVRSMAKAGATMIVTARDEAKFQQLAASVKQSVPDAKLAFLQLELSDLDSCRLAAESVLADYPQLDIIIANAGVMGCEFAKTAQDFEWQFGVNHLGHFLFVNKLVPLLTGDDPRVVVLSSAGHQASDVDLEDYNFDHTPYEKWTSYGRAKTANVLYAVELNRRMPKGTANAVHPGAIATTELGRHLTADDAESLAKNKEEGQWEFKSMEAGAATQVWAATAPEFADQGGLYLEDCQVSVPTTTRGAGYREYARDPDSARALWELSERLVGETFSW